jgi:hypothetical protein
MLRSFQTQLDIPDYDNLSWSDRRLAVRAKRSAKLATLASNPTKLAKKKLFYRKTDPYIHLNRTERNQVVQEFARAFGSEREARLFGAAIQKSWFESAERSLPMFEFAFDSVINRFHHFLANRANYVSRTNPSEARRYIGIIVQDKNPGMSDKLSNLMRRFQREGTFFQKIDRIIETPFFVDSELTNMVQIADICAYAVRKYLDNADSRLFDIAYQRVDMAGQTQVGLRHFCQQPCQCKMCKDHGVRPFTLGAALR